MKLIRWRWDSRTYKFVIEEITEKDSGRITERTIETAPDAKTAQTRTLELRAQRDGLYPTDKPSLSHNGSS